MNPFTRSNIITEFIRLLLCIVLFASPTAQSRQASMAVIGISIDDFDRFTMATSDVEILSRGYFEVQEPFSVDVTLSESLVPRLEPGHFWSSLAAEGEGASKLVRAVLSTLKSASGDRLPPLSVCAITSPVALTTSQMELVSLALKDTFDCTDEAFVIRETHAVTSSLNIEGSDVEESPIAVIVPNEYTYILEEDYSMALVVDTFPPPVNLDLVVVKHNIKEFIVVQDSENPRFGQTYGPSKIPIRYQSSDILAHGAAIMATLSLPQEPVSILPLPLGVTLHGLLSHIVILPFSVLPKSVKLTLTTVHDNQRTAVIEVREGHRARASDNNLITKLNLKDIPPAPAGKVPIEVTLTAERDQYRITVEAVETLSGRKAEVVVERDGLGYPEGVLEELQGAREKYMEEDGQFRASVGKIVSREIQPDDAVQIFVEPPNRHEEL